MTSTTAKKPEPSPFATHLRGFSVGAVAACCAVTITNPMEVVKTRLQLQGELEDWHLRAKGSGSAPPKVYNGAVSAFVKIFRTEGIRGIQRGLAPAYVYQVLLNGTRLGFYEPIRDMYQSFGKLLAPTTTVNPSAFSQAGQNAGKLLSMVAAGATSGILGAFLASPLYLVKTRMQSYTTATSAHAAGAVGFQHTSVSRGALYALYHVWKHEGVRGLWRGVDAAMLRTGIGSAVQLSSYDVCKQALIQSGWFGDASGNQVRLHFAASAVTSLLVCIAMNPFDVVSTRMYNQPVAADGKHGGLYNSAFDCIIKTVRTEGFAALYKGFSAHYLRIGPHTILTFVFLEQTKNAAAWLLD